MSLGARLAAVVSIFALLLLGGVIRDSTRRVDQPFPGFLFWDNGIVVALHGTDWTGPLAGVPITGRVLSVDAESFESGSAVLRKVAAEPVGTPFSYRVHYHDAESVYTVPSMRMGWGAYMATFGIYLANAALLFFVAAIALFLRPDRIAAWAVAFAATVLGVVLTLSVDILTTYRFAIPFAFVETLLPGALACLALAFPADREFTPARRRWAGATLAGLSALGAAQMYWFRQAPEWYERVNLFVYLMLGTALLGLLTSFTRQLLRSRSAEARMQAGIVFAGAITAVVPASALIFATELLGASISYSWIVAFVPFLPLSVLYAVVYRDLLQAERFIRLSVGYALASAGLLLVYSTGLAALERTVLPGVSTHPATLFGVAFLLAVAMDPVRRRVQILIDRVFFRTPADTAAILEQTPVQFARLRDAAAISRHLEQVVASALSLEWAELHVEEGPARTDTQIEQTLSLGKQRFGTLHCGPKRSGAPFSAGEREIVRALASQAALALQNAESLDALRSTQADLVRSERLAAIGELAGAIAHGIRNPLAGIRAAAQVASELNEDAAVEEPVSDIVSEVDRLDSRLRRLLDFSRPFEPELELHELVTLLTGISRGMSASAQKRGVELSLALPDPPMHAKVDAGLVEEALQELVGNALHAMDSGGTLRIELAADPALPGTVSIRVVDSGAGIPDGARERIFDLFYTSRPDGTGIGLAATKRIIERLGGRVALEHTGPEGSIFRIDLPA